MTIETELFNMKKKIEDSKTEKHQTEGEIKQLLKQLEQFDISTLEEAESTIKKMNGEVEALDSGLIAMVASLKEKYNWSRE